MISRRIFRLLSNQTSPKVFSVLPKQTQLNSFVKYSFSQKQGDQKPPSSSVPKQREPEDLPYLELTRDFLDPKEFYQVLEKNGVNFYTGVPDSLLKDFCAYVSDVSSPSNHIITANEGSAVSLAAGYHLATNQVPLVYLQNSGLGNIINPIMSLAHSKVYGIPMLLLIGWRGEPGQKDEPQHLVMGKTMTGILTEMGIQYEVLPDYIEGAAEAVESAVYTARKRNTPYAFIVQRQCFTNYKMKKPATNKYQFNREQILNMILPLFGSHDAVVGTTGFLSRELYETRENLKHSNEKDFLCVGSMGHANSIALGVAMIKQSRTVWCLDGDGAALMHLGHMATVGAMGLPNFKHILFNNEAHDSVGAQPTIGGSIDFCKIAEGCKYKKFISVSEPEDIQKAILDAQNTQGTVFVEIKCKPGARKDLGRPQTSTAQNKTGFMDYLNY